MSCPKAAKGGKESYIMFAEKSEESKLTAHGASSLSWSGVGGQEAVTPNCCTTAPKLLLLLPLLLRKASYEAEGGRRTWERGVGVGVGDGEREEFSGSRTETASFASWATNMAKDSSSA